jgi:copper(I)-binding protein
MQAMRIPIACRAGRVIAGALFALLMAAPALADIRATDGWSRATVPGAAMGVGYFTLTNTGKAPRKLLRITSTACENISLHASSVDAQGMAHMWPIATLELRGGETLRFEPNGRHLMLEGLHAPLVAGARVSVTLQFDGGEKAVVARLEVRPLVPEP